jgi:hypothetical protein
MALLSDIKEENDILSKGAIMACVLRINVAQEKV